MLCREFSIKKGKKGAECLEYRTFVFYICSVLIN